MGARITGSNGAGVGGDICSGVKAEGCSFCATGVDVISLDDGAAGLGADSVTINVMLIAIRVKAIVLIAVTTANLDQGDRRIRIK